MTTVMPEHGSTVSFYSPFSADPTLPLPERTGRAISVTESLLRGAFAPGSAPGSGPDVFEREVFRTPDNPPSPRVQQAAREIKDLTGWSNRRLAQALGVTHPTVKAIEKGGAGALARSPHVQRRLSILHQVLSRIAPLAERKRYPLAQALEQAAQQGGLSALELVRMEDGNRAYLAALDVISPRRRGKMIRSSHPVKPGRSSVELTE